MAEPSWKADHPEAVREYRVAESRQKEDRKQVTRARRIVAAKLKREQTASQQPTSTSLVVVDAYTRQMLGSMHRLRSQLHPPFLPAASAPHPSADQRGHLGAGEGNRWPTE